MNNSSENSFKYRHEQKYICTAQQLADIENTIKCIMKKDAHANEEGKYLIRSVYFDDYQNSFYQDNEDGNNPREKFRIRTYNCSKEYIKLELKKKENGKTLKDSCELDYETCMGIINTGDVFYKDNAEPVYNKLFYLNKTRGLKPKCLVEYERTVYVCEQGNVRITFDKNISSCLNINELFLPVIAKRPIMPLGVHVLEVKYDEFLPDIIYRSLQKGCLKETTFSKYYYCRKLSMR